MAFREELTSAYGERVHLVPEDEQGRLDLSGWLATPSPHTKIYCCGPSALLDAVERAAAHWPAHSLRTERFSATEQPEPVRRAFQVELRRSGITVTVAPDLSVLRALRQAGVDLLSSCEQGVCGTCLTTVLEGRPDHRDSLLSPDERAADDCMYPCVSRSCGDRLVLDL
ncbi:flavin reductase family protein [Streptomyces sp. NPDC056161]|uniref:flavin reductase family protein n=1 Tax=Streptomyces sp. NPDC056161 TaxID=3345732 RepID=UPI0035D6E388